LRTFVPRWGRAQQDGEVRVVRLRGAGRAFCAGLRHRLGLGVDAGGRSGAPWDPIADYETMRGFVDAYMSLWRSPKPVVAQVHGACVAGGTDFALCSDLIVCSEDCRIGYPPARVWGSPTTAMWMYRLGLERSKRLLLTGDAIDGARACEWGLASEAVPAAELEAAGLALARRVALLPHNQAAHDEAARQPGLRADGPAHHAARSARCWTARRATRPRGRPSRSAPSRTFAAPWPTATRRSATTARDRRRRRRWPGAAASERSWPAAAAGASAATRPWSSSRAGRWCTTRSDVLRAVLDEVAIVAKQSTVLPASTSRSRSGWSPRSRAIRWRASSTRCAARAGGPSWWWAATCRS
jgi:enoyl-CoA hydratase/carnithine racemase